MTFKLSLLSAAVLAATGLSMAHAQTPGTAPPGGGTTAPKGGQPSTANQDKGSAPKASAESRADVKADTSAAKAAASIPQGQQSTANQGKQPMKTTPAENSRAEVKADAKSGTTPKGGQESVKDQNKGGVKP